MRTVTATEASRSFAALLDQVEQGETVVVTRGGRRVAVMGPTTNGNGSAVLNLLDRPQVDERFAADVESAIASVDSESPSWPED
jgi:antitoxin (DNA-binding transcriptional repressor) of toxin-antitoxin stability system